MAMRVLLLMAFVFIGATYPSLAQGPDYSIEDSVWGDVYFDSGSASLTDKAKKDLNGVSAWIKKHPAAMVLLAGYDDQRTPEADAMDLGWKRAGAVKDYLAKQGVNPDKINTISFGNKKLAVTGKGEEVWSKNRRVRYRVVEPGGGDKMGNMPGGVCQRCKK